MDERIGQSLLRAGIMTATQVEEVLTRQRAGDDRLFGEIAIAMGYINEDALQSYLGISIALQKNSSKSQSTNGITQGK